jgi:hypothetical protein
LISAHPSQAQLGSRTGIKAGYNFSSISGDEFQNKETLQSLTFGIGLEFNMLFISLQAEALYSPRGVSVEDVGDVSLKYVSVPIFLKKKFFPMLIHPYIYAGPEFSFLLSAKSGDVDIKDNIQSQDLAAVAGVGLEFSFIGKSAYIEARHTYGLKNINKGENTVDSKNRVYQVFIGLFF